MNRAVKLKDTICALQSALDVNPLLEKHRAEENTLSCTSSSNMATDPVLFDAEVEEGKYEDIEGSFFSDEDEEDLDEGDTHGTFCLGKRKCLNRP